MSENSSKFAVVLDGIKLPQEVEKAIESEIKQIVMKHLATLDLSSGIVLSGYHPPKWHGYWPVNLASILASDALKNTTAKIQEKTNAMMTG